MDNLQNLLGTRCEITIFQNVFGRIIRFEISNIGVLAEVRYVTNDNMIIEEWFFLDELSY